jgi:hypothetical protein
MAINRSRAGSTAAFRRGFDRIFGRRFRARRPSAKRVAEFRRADRTAKQFARRNLTRAAGGKTSH